MLQLDLNELRPSVSEANQRQAEQGLQILARLGLLPPGLEAPYRRVPGDICWRCGGPVFCGIASMHRCRDLRPPRQPHATPPPRRAEHSRPPRQSGFHRAIGGQRDREP